jgi:hypothetical protein
MGPGRGECVVVHLGNNDWCVVDSCIDRSSGLPVALDYLQSLNTDALSGVRMIIATHWHDDHIRGLASLVAAVPSAKFCCSAALGSSHFAELVGIAAEGTLVNSGLAEFRNIYELLTDRNEHVPPRLLTPILANENKRLLHLEDSERSCTASITALSPSDGRIKMAIEAFALSIPSGGEIQRRIDPNQNDTSVALWVQFGEHCALLGADLEHTGHHGEGWLAVIDSFQGSSKGRVYKVPHHGSANGHHQEVWDRLLIPSPIAVVTPYSSGKTPLPRPSDVDRMKQLTSELYCTSTGTAPLPRRDSMVEKETKKFARKVIGGSCGHVRIRWSTSSPEPTVELFNGAYKVV